MNLAEIYSIFYSTAAEYTFFTVAHGTSSRIDHLLGHKASFNKYNEIEVISCILSDHNVIKAKINKTNCRKYPNTWRLNSLYFSDEVNH
jgi:hypothetical protein